MRIRSPQPPPPLHPRQDGAPARSTSRPAPDDPISRGEAAAAKLYGGSSKSAPASAATPPTATAARTLYDPALGIRQMLQRRQKELFEVGLSAAERAALERDLVSLANGLPQAVAQRIAADVLDERMRVRRETPEETEIRTEARDERIRENNEVVRQRLAGLGGSVDDAEALLERTRRYVQSQPELKRIFDAHPVSDPELVEAISLHVQRSGFR